MKRFIKFSLLTGIVLVSIFNSDLQAQDKSEAQAMLQNKEKKEQVFNAIIDNPELKKEMMQRMMKSAKKDSSACEMMSNMMMDDNHMMDMMMSGMMDKAESDDGMCKKMCMMMMESDKMMNMMDGMKDKKQKGRKENNEKPNMEEHMDQHNE